MRDTAIDSSLSGDESSDDAGDDAEGIVVVPREVAGEGDPADETPAKRRGIGQRTVGRRPESMSPEKGFLNRLGSFPPLEAEEEAKLIRKYKKSGDMAAREKLLLHYQRLVIKIASSFAGRSGGSTLMDLIQEGNLGMIKALEKFDPAKSARFITYASWWIKAYIIIYLKSHDKPMNFLSTHGARKASSHLSRAIGELENILGRRPTHAEIADHLNLREDDVDRAVLASKPTISIDKPVGDEDGNSRLADFLIGANEEDVTDLIDVEDSRGRIRKVLSTLPERDEAILRLRLGFDGEEPLTLLEVGDRVGISRERVRQLEVRALRRAYRSATSCRLKDFLD